MFRIRQPSGLQRQDSGRIYYSPGKKFEKLHSNIQASITISFLIQAKQHANNSEKFHKDLLENGAEFPATFSSNLHRIINNTGAEKRTQ